MESIKLLTPLEYTDEERELLIGFVLALRKTHIKEFLKRTGLTITGTKPELRSRLEEAIDDGSLSHGQLVDYLDSVAPWGKQHVFLYKGPRGDIKEWKDHEHVLGILKQHRLGKLFNARLPLVLPEKLTLSSITHSKGRLRVSAVQKREYTERTPAHDENKKTEDNEKITLKAFVHHVTRTLVIFEWDLSANEAMLQITQLQKEGDYEEIAKEFFKLTSPWLDIKQFDAINLRSVIHNLQEKEENGKAEARSHGIDYQSLRGRRISARSPSPRDSVLGEDYINDALLNFRKNGVGHLGNFYWLQGVDQGAVPNPLKNDIRVVVVGAKSRVNFPTPNNEETIRYVLHRVRELSC